ncbi:TraR/DksA C4-type zinc finger protein [Streptomyces sp. SID12488]|uniref:TraR/DksA family transcriptional regulator n=1 Tax=Streptomyces sp. SID12488 TaxID=2706040 RepID=UPI0013D96E9F|nr:TraR/DksA C4-type zinc finger protein [Streptomyces sp. SID12488]NEA65880.1 DNA-binding protein [Streptomyces sp. SID12488]
MVAKKTAEQQSTTGRSTGSTAAGASGSGKGTDAKKSALKKSAVKKTAATKAVASTSVAKKTVAKRAVTKTAAVKTAAVKTAAVKTAVVKKAAASESTAAHSGTGTRTSTKSTARKSTANRAGAAEAAKTTGATTVVAKKTAGTTTTAKKPSAVPKARIVAATEPGELAVRPGEDPWTPEEVAEARAGLQSEVQRLRAEIAASEQSLAGLMRDSGDGAGDDQADTGTKNTTREAEMALAANAREMLVQDERALERLDTGTYGLCESCGKAIGKARTQAFPRATMCVECKQKQERRY